MNTSNKGIQHNTAKGYKMVYLSKSNKTTTNYGNTKCLYVDQALHMHPLTGNKMN